MTILQWLAGLAALIGLAGFIFLCVSPGHEGQAKRELIIGDRSELHGRREPQRRRCQSFVN